jgi:hypothetical protein
MKTSGLLKLSAQPACKVFRRRAKWLRRGLVGLALLAFGLCVQADTGTNWKTFTDPAGRFSILMPGEPQHQTDSSPASNGKPASHSDLYMTGENGNIYMAGTTIYDLASMLDVEGELAANRDNFDQGINARVTSQQRLKFGDYPALEFKSSGPQANFSALVVLAGPHCYMVVAAYHTADEPPEVMRFFRSYKLISP